MLWDEKLWMISTKRRKINDETKNEEKEKNQNAITACHAAEKILMKQRSLNVIETEKEVNLTTVFDAANRKNKIFTADIAADEKEINRVTVDSEAVKKEKKTEE